MHALNYCMLLPGPEAQQLATYIGWLMHRSWGGIVAGVLFVLPSFFILVALSWVYVRFGHNPGVEGIFYGIKPAVTALVLHAAWRIGTRVLKNRCAVGCWRHGFFRGHLRAAGAVSGHRGRGGAVWCGHGGRLAPQVFATGGAGPAAEDAAASSCGGGAGAGGHRRRHTHAAACPFHAPAWCGCCWPARCCGVADGTAGGHARLAWAAGADGLVLHQGRAADLWRRLRRAALRLPRRGGTAAVAQRHADDRRPGAGRNHARPLDHGGGLRGLRGCLVQALVRA
jgi:hypothetical protein